MSKKCSISALLNKDTKTERKRTKVICNCIDCNGSFIDPRTKIIHESLVKRRKNSAIIDRDPISTPFRPRKRRPASNHVISFDEQHNSAKYNKLTSKYVEKSLSEVNVANKSKDFDESDDESDEFQDFDEFEDYSTPNFELPNFNNDNIPKDDRFMWILLWIMNFRIKFNLPDIATDALIKFVKLVLTEIGGAECEPFCNSLYSAKKQLGLFNTFVSFVACKKCHKDEVINFRQENQISIMKCTHIEFPNSVTRRKNICNTNLSKQSKLLNGSIVNRPELIFPYTTIRQQLAVMYRRPGFKDDLRHWANRPDFGDISCDIYDGNIWKTFKDTPSEDLFFRTICIAEL
jgi:hypothetical protein